VDAGVALLNMRIPAGGGATVTEGGLFPPGFVPDLVGARIAFVRLVVDGLDEGGEAVAIGAGTTSAAPPGRLARQILEQSTNNQPNQVKAERGVLIVELHDFVLGEGQHFHLGFAYRAGRALLVWRE
jgi:hypothetical protein